MLPVVSSAPVPGLWEEPVNSRTDDLIDHEAGGPALFANPEDAESRAYLWTADYEGGAIRVYREGVAPATLLSVADVSLVSLAFDAAMNPHVAYVAGGEAHWYWWDTLSQEYQTTALPGARWPRCTSDEKNPLISGERDVVLTYLKGAALCVRLQRDRFNTEYALSPDPATHEPILPTTRLISFGRNTGYRLQWRFE